MQKLVCSVRDIVANVYSLPFTAHNVGTAIRDFAQAVSDPASQLNKSPDGYSLYSIGEFNEDTGEIAGHVPVHLANATQFVKE